MYRISHVKTNAKSRAQSKVFKPKHEEDTFKGNLFTQPGDVHFKQQPWAGFPRQGEIGQMDWVYDLRA